MKFHEFFEKNDLSKYAGKYVAIANNELVSYGDSIKEVFEEAKRKYPNENPLITMIPKGTMIMGLEALVIN